jgi:hypothetical protein
LSLQNIIRGSMVVLILLPFCACLDVQSVILSGQEVHHGDNIRLTVEFAPPTTEGWESGEFAIGLLCIRMPADWRFMEGYWTIAGGKSGNIVSCTRIAPKLEAGVEETAIVLSSDQVISRSDLVGEISAQIVLKTGTKSGLFSLLFLGGATDSNFSDVIWSNAAALRKDVTVN